MAPSIACKYKLYLLLFNSACTRNVITSVDFLLWKKATVAPSIADKHNSKGNRVEYLPNGGELRYVVTAPRGRLYPQWIISILSSWGVGFERNWVICVIH